MTSEDFKYIVGWLTNKVKPDYEKESEVKTLAEGSYKPLPGVISALWAMFDRHLFESKEKMIRYADGFIYAFNGRWFEKVEDSAFIEELVRRVLGELGTQSVYRLVGAQKIAKPLLNRLKLTTEFAYEPDRRWIVFPNGVLDLKNRTFKADFSINYCTDIILDFEYNPRVSGILWNTKLKEIIPSSGFRNDFQQFCGSLLADRKIYKKEFICYLHGGGGNGKSVIASAIAGVFGHKYSSSFTLNQIFAKETAALFVVNELKGKLLNVSDDVTAKDVSGGVFKSFVSGEPMPGRGVGKGDWKEVTPPMLLCCINEFPDVLDDSEGNHRRQLIINTTIKQWDGEEKDTNLSAKLATTESRQSIFNWIYEGYCKYVGHKGEISLSKDSILARQQRKADSSPMRRWASERFFVRAVPVDNADPRWQLLEDLYLDYRKFCIQQGYSYEADARKIGAMFVSMGFEKKNLNGKGTRVCIGVLGKDTDENGNIIKK